MPSTLLHQFYKTARDFPEKPFVHFKIKGSYHTFPWWIYKSKVKHFVLGLIHRGFQAGDAFLICAPNCPEWIYTEMALFTVGMVSVTCVERLEEENLLKLIQESKASGILIGWPSLLDRFARIQNRLPPLKSVIATDEAIQKKYPKLNLSTFREVFNEGVYHEDQLRSSYWKLRDERRSEDRATVFYRIKQGSLQQASEWSYQKIKEESERILKLGVRLFRKQILNLAPLSNIQARLIGLYLPILQEGISSFLSEEENIIEACRYSKPHILFVSELKKDLLFHEILRLLDQQIGVIRKIQNWRFSSSSFKKKIGKKLFERKIKKILGGRIKQIVFEKGNIPDQFATLLKEANLKILFMPNESKEYPVSNPI